MEAQPIDPKKSKKKYGKYDDWEIESAARTLEEAELIKADPEKMKYVKMCMESKVKATEKALSSIDELREIGKKKMSEKAPAEDTEDESY